MLQPYDLKSGLRDRHDLTILQLVKATIISVECVEAIEDYASNFLLSDFTCHDGRSSPPPLHQGGDVNAHADEGTQLITGKAQAP